MKLTKPLPPIPPNGDKKKTNGKMKKVEFRINLSPKNILVWFLIAFFGLSFLSSLMRPGISAEEINLSKALNDVKDGGVKEILIDGDRLLLTYKDEKKYSTRKEPGESLVKTFESSGIDPKSVELKVVDQTTTKVIADILGTILPLVLMGVFFFYIFRQAKGAQDNIFSFGRSGAKIFAKGKQAITFKDVAGVDEAKKELEEVVDFLKHPQKYRALGARTPKGVLLVGPSGVGKTLLAKAMAGEAGVPFFSMAGSEFMEMLVGVGASRTRDLFSTAKKAAPCLPGETRISLADGQQFTIEEMFRKKMIGARVISMTDDGETEEAKVIAITRRKFPQLCQIKTLHQQIEATPNHLFPVCQVGQVVWKRADELSEKDYLAYPRKISFLGEKIFLLDLLPPETRIYLKKENLLPTRHLKSRKLADWKEKKVDQIDYLALGRGGWTDSRLQKIPAYPNRELAYLLGLLVSDGNFSKTSRFNISFINTQQALHQRVKKIIQTNFGYSPRMFLDSQSKKGLFPNRKKCWVTHINNRLIRILLENLQEKLLILPEDLISAFISGFFDGDGCVAKKGSLPKIIFSVWDEKTNEVLRSLLHRLGIVAYWSEKGNIEITGKEAVNFLREKIVSFHPQKTKKLADLNLLGRTGSRLDAIPVGGFLREVRQALSVSQRDLKMGGKISDYENGKHVPSRESLRKVIYRMEELMRVRGIKPASEFFRLKKLVFGNIGFSKATQISLEEKPGYVYDLCLNDHHNFVANGLFVHNCIIFIDEIDAIGRQRGSGFMGGHDEREQTLNQILVEMDGFTPNDNVMVIAATNRGDLLDPALLRPGRFDRTVVLDMPDLEGRKAILQIHAKGKKFADVSWEKIAKRTVGFSGADLENMLNEAAISAARLNKKEIEESDTEEAAVKVKLGPERKRLQSDEDKKMTAYHEAGHAVVNYYAPHTDPVHRISIVARGMSLGHTLIAPLKDRSHETKTRLLEQINVMMGGRVAEELEFSEMTTGAANDLLQATRIARAMVVDFGMSKLGPIFLGNRIAEDEGRAFFEPNNLSPEMQAKIDNQIKSILDFAYESAQKILKENKTKLDKIAKVLTEKETLEEEEFAKLMK